MRRSHRGTPSRAHGAPFDVTDSETKVAVSGRRLSIVGHSFEELVVAGDFLGALHKVPPEERTLCLWSFSGTDYLDDVQLRGMLAGAWSLGTDDAFRLSPLPPPEMEPYELKLWLELFERAGYVKTFNVTG